MKKNVLDTKIRIPEYTQTLVMREALLMKMCHIPESLVVIQAGSGYGKTSVAAEYLKIQKKTCLWYRLDHTDNDPGEFVASFAVALQKQIVDFCLEPATHDWTVTDVEATAMQILSQLEVWNQNLTIVLDDFQTISDKSLYMFFECLFRYSSQKIRFILITNASFPEFLSKFYLQGKLAVINREDLKITREDLLRHIKQTGQMRKITMLDIDRILACSEGWAIAVNNLLHITCEEDEVFCRLNLWNYMECEIWNILSEDYQRFLMESAALHLITPDVCNFVFGIQDAQVILEYFVEEQMLIERQKNQVYHYHPLLQQFLGRKLQEEDKKRIQLRETLYYDSQKQETVWNPVSEAKRKNRRCLISFSDINKKCYISCFGEMSVHGEEKRPLHWRTRKTKELFAFLWENQGVPLGKEEMIEALWQDADGQNVEALFHTTLSYLKKACTEYGIPDIIQVVNKKYVMQQGYMISDISQLHGMYEQWKNNLFADEIEQNFQDLNHIYKGEYLADIDSFWVLPKREYYVNMYLKCCEILARQAQKKKQYETTVHILEHAIRLDPYSEEFNGMLLESLGILGEVRLAKRHYDHYKRIMKEELNLKIGKQVQDSYRNHVLQHSG